MNKKTSAYSIQVYNLKFGCDLQFKIEDKIKDENPKKFNWKPWKKHKKTRSSEIFKLKPYLEPW